VAPGAGIFNDMFTIYPFENQMFVLKLTGREIKDLLEYSYDKWITTPG
jgi:2',3'-cyclic-nucleotide 2'-phosphodiesterase/3'-nucleotidase